MPSYLTNIPTYIPKVQPYTPNFNLFSSVNQFKQGQYDANKQQLSNLYGSLLNSPLTREDNIEAREKFFKTIDQDIKKISRMDLSLKQNVNVAKGVFNQLLDNKNISHDMAWTKNFQKEGQRSQAFKNCKDPEECGGSWWEGGDRYLNYHKEAYKNADPNSAMNMRSPSYVPQQDVMKKAMDLAKEADLSVKQDQVSGQWIVTTKNGQQLVGPLMSLFSGTLAKDGKIRDYYKAQSFVQRNDFMYQNEAQYGSKEAAEQAYIQQLLPGLEQAMGTDDIRLKDLKEHVGQKLKKIETLESQGAGAAGSFDDIKKTLMAEDQAYSESLVGARNAKGEYEVAKRNGKFLGSQIDNLMTQYSLKKDITAAAQTLAMKDTEMSVKANPYGVEAAKQKNRFLFEKYKFQNRIDLEKYKFDLESLEKAGEGKGSSESNTPQVVDAIPGSTTKEGDSSAFTVYNDARNAQEASMSAGETTVLTEAISRISGAAEAGDPQAKEDYVNIFRNYVNASGTQPERLMGSDDAAGATLAMNNKQILAELDAAPTLQERYQIAKRAKMDINNIGGSQIDELYQNTITDMMTPDKSANKSLRNYLQPLWQKTAGLRKKIDAKQNVLGQMDDAYAQEVKEVIQTARTKEKYKDLADVFDAYSDGDGHPVDRPTFIRNMVSKGRSVEEAEQLYDGKYEMDPAGFWSYAGVAAATVTGLGALGGGAAAYGLLVPDEEDYTSIHDLFASAYSDLVEPKGNEAWLALTGGSDQYANGQRFERVDPAEYKSLGTKASISVLKDAFQNGAIFDAGYFTDEIPEGSDDDAKNFMKIVYNSMITETKGKARPILDVTYSGIAGGTSDKVGVNIKVSNYDYLKRYAGSAKNAGPAMNVFDDLQPLMDDGVTIYMDKDKANNLFTQGTSKSSYEVLMEHNKSIDMDAHPDYTKDMKFEFDETTGQYKLHGLVKGYNKETGQEEWKYRYVPVSSGAKLDDAVMASETKLNEYIGTVMAYEKAQRLK